MKSSKLVPRTEGFDANVTAIIVAANGTGLVSVWRNFEHEDRVRRDCPINAPSIIGYRKSDARFVAIMCGPPTLLDASWRDVLTAAGAVVVHASEADEAAEEIRRVCS